MSIQIHSPASKKKVAKQLEASVVASSYYYHLWMPERGNR